MSLIIMDHVETGSSNTSIDKSDDFCENPTRDTLTEGLMTLLKPALDQLDDRVKAVRFSQVDLKKQLEELNEELVNVAAEQNYPIDLDHYITELNNFRHKISVVSNILQAAQDRLNKIQVQINKESAKRKVLSEAQWGELEDVYEPSEDTFFLLDTLEEELEAINTVRPTIVLEIGSGSGVVITAMAKALGSYAHCFAIDINPNACLSTKDTSKLNSTDELLSVVCGDLVSSFRLNNQVDLLIFNPPYVVTEPDEIGGSIARAWAGGVNGTQVLERLLPNVAELLSNDGIGYIVLIEENLPGQIKTKLDRYGIKSTIIAKKKIPGEKLFIMKLTKKKPSSLK